MFREEEVKYTVTYVICDKCGSKRELWRDKLGFDARMNLTLANGYAFKSEDGVFKNYCFSCRKGMES